MGKEIDLYVKFGTQILYAGGIDITGTYKQCINRDKLSVEQ